MNDSNHAAVVVLLTVLAILAMGIAGAGASSPLGIVRMCAPDKTEWYVLEGGAAMFPASLKIEGGVMKPVQIDVRRGVCK